jgi:hypothetical protein
MFSVPAINVLPRVCDGDSNDLHERELLPAEFISRHAMQPWVVRTIDWPGSMLIVPARLLLPIIRDERPNSLPAAVFLP